MQTMQATRHIRPFEQDFSINISENTEGHSYQNVSDIFNNLHFPVFTFPVLISRFTIAHHGSSTLPLRSFRQYHFFIQFRSRSFMRVHALHCGGGAGGTSSTTATLTDLSCVQDSATSRALIDSAPVRLSFVKITRRDEVRWIQKHAHRALVVDFWPRGAGAHRRLGVQIKSTGPIR